MEETNATISLTRLHDSEALQSCKAYLQQSNHWPFTNMPKMISIASNIDLPAGDELIIIVEQNMHLTITEQEHTTTLLIIQENANVRYITTSGKAVQRIAYLNKNAHLVWIDAATKATASKNTTILNGEGADARFSSIFIGTNNDSFATEATMIHATSHTSSNMLTRAALLDNSTGSYRGLIKILPNAIHCEAYQREDTLLLGDNARMTAVPILEISNNDVKCSHGVAIGQVDDEQLFYLESRGINPSDAKHMIIEGFFDPLLISMGDNGLVLRSKLHDQLSTLPTDSVQLRKGVL